MKLISKLLYLDKNILSLRRVLTKYNAAFYNGRQLFGTSDFIGEKCLIIEDRAKDYYTEIGKTGYVPKTSTIKFSSGRTTTKLYYSFVGNKSTFKEWNWQNENITLPANGKVYIYGDNPDGININATSSQICYFTITGSYVGLDGDLRALIGIDPSKFTRRIYDFEYLFKNNPNIVYPMYNLSFQSDLSDVYRYMFVNCTNLLYTPTIMSAQTLVDCAYEAMFKGCTSLKKGPAEFGAIHTDGIYTELTGSGWSSQHMREMFSGCVSLSDLKALNRINIDRAGTMTFYSMFKGCKKLTRVPVINTTIFGNEACCGMFSGCSSLMNISSRITVFGINGTQPFEYMFNGCTNLNSKYTIWFPPSIWPYEDLPSWIKSDSSAYDHIEFDTMTDQIIDFDAPIHPV